ncbi:hypothetical protein I862_00760 [endosymbiont of Acanthamoeba sp. UWC8]|nr:hypothetical protein I862_00760 [endosymbiont of Acanthamoeba sp. UWC8]
MQMQENQNQYSNIKPSNLKATSRKKAIMIGVLFGLSIPSITLEVAEFPHTMDYLIKLGLGAVVIAPIVAFITFISIRNMYKCPKCKSHWSYFKVNETIIESFAVAQPLKKTNNAAESVRNERYLVESECGSCHFRSFKHKKRKVIKKGEEL